MYIYIDNNVLIDHEEANMLLPKSVYYNYVYSRVHMQELIELKDKLNRVKERRLKTIEELTNNLHVSHNRFGQLTIIDKSPSLEFSSINNPLVSIVMQQMREATENWQFDRDPKCLINRLGIEKRIINNYKPEQLVGKYGRIIRLYLNKTCQNKREEFQSLFNILDGLGFWQDDVYKGSTLNRLFDASHAYFSTVCDFFVTNDAKTKNKANVAYNIWGYKTKAISYNEFIKIKN